MFWKVAIFAYAERDSSTRSNVSRDFLFHIWLHIDIDKFEKSAWPLARLNSFGDVDLELSNAREHAIAVTASEFVDLCDLVSG